MSKQEERDKMAAEVERWLASGRTIESVPPGATGIRDKNVVVMGSYVFPSNRWKKGRGRPIV